MLNTTGARVPVDQLAELLADEPEVRWRAAAGLAQVRTREAVQALGRALYDGEPLVSWAAAQALGEIARQATDRAVPVAVGQAILGAVEAKEAGPRAAAADALAAWGEQAPLEPALLLAGDAEPTVRAAAVRALGLAGSRTGHLVVPVLQAAVDDPDLEVRRMAANAIGWCRDEGSAAALRARLRDPVGVVRAAALRALARLGDSIDEAAALAMLKDRDLAARVEAIRFLRLRGGETCVRALAELEKDRVPLGEATVGALAREARRQVLRRQGPWLIRVLRQIFRRRRAAGGAVGHIDGRQVRAGGRGGA